MAVATTYFHVVAARESLTKVTHPTVLVQALIYLACKAEEQHRRLRDIMAVVHRLRYPAAELIHLGSEHSTLRDFVVSSEQLILRILGFNLHVDLPYNYLYNYCKLIQAPAGLVKVATALLNDLYPFSIILEYEPTLLAAACLFLALHLSTTPTTAMPEVRRACALVEGEEERATPCHALPTSSLPLLDPSTSSLPSHDPLTAPMHPPQGTRPPLNPSSPSLPLHFLQLLALDTTLILDIVQRMLEYYRLPEVMLQEGLDMAPSSAGSTAPPNTEPSPQHPRLPSLRLPMRPLPLLGPTLSVTIAVRGAVASSMTVSFWTDFSAATPNLHLTPILYRSITQQLHNKDR